MAHDKVRVAVIGASGYSGIEAVRILSAHPFVEISALTSEHYAGREVADVYRHMDGTDLPPFEELRPGFLAGRADAVISCLPEKIGYQAISELVQSGVKVVDISADYRLKDPAIHRATYGFEHASAALVKEAVYGLTEFHRSELREARLVANPGCYPTGALLGLIPLIRRDLIDPSSIVIDAKSGTTGARRAASVEYLFAEVNENFRAYNLFKHRHTPEVADHLRLALTDFVFTTHLLPVDRGILSTLYVRLAASRRVEEVEALFRQFYAGRPLVRVMAGGNLPELQHVTHTNFCDIGFALDSSGERLIVVSCLDNLGKGAAGQAVQNLNRMKGYPETAGLL